ncbi:cytochrome P450 [Lindgomyces ingoldianus]|uniref:Cytochrome P450 n=1 Tax=Lindgomyces ingoldianus TaxID=673940 RepID=A0ACB6QZU6_9PLEO|nr:cytochrome P450 [Lindgomyces ingoldianus]KAF2472307.1 cytochrome P450 [Lindgomyces ingoldianus]
MVSLGSYALVAPLEETPLILVFGIPFILWFWALFLQKKAKSRLETLLKPILKRIAAWRFLLHGPSMIQQAFTQSHGDSFEILAPDTRYVFVSSPKHIKELDDAPDTVLSLQAASKHMLQPHYTMHGFNWFHRRGTEGVGFVRALRTLLTNNLPNILPDLSVIIRTRFSQFHAEHRLIKGERHSPVYQTIVKLVVLSNAISFFGHELAKDEILMTAALAYIEETVFCAEILRLLPKLLVPFVGGIIARRKKCHEVLFNALMPVAEERCRERDRLNLGQTVPKHADCIQWIMETSPRKAPWTAKRIVHELMAIWFGSVHAMSTTVTFAIHDLCIHPEYVEPLREELKNRFADFERTGNGLPLLDSFIKESARLTPVESLSTRRCAIQPFTLSDGTKVNKGDWACTPVRAIMQHKDYYPEPLEFNGFRFVNPALIDLKGKFKSCQPNPSNLVDVGDTYHVWGTGRMACPGRYYAAAIMKLIVAQVIQNYDCSLADPEALRWWTWRSSMLPKESTMIIFRPL